MSAAAAAGAVDYKRSRSHALHTVAKHGFLVQKFIFVKNLLKIEIFYSKLQIFCIWIFLIFRNSHGTTILRFHFICRFDGIKSQNSSWFDSEPSEITPFDSHPLPYLDGKCLFFREINFLGVSVSVSLPQESGFRLWVMSGVSVIIKKIQRHLVNFGDF